MKLTQWTENQQDAIDSRRGTILVSAAAGSGKTAVLVERVIACLIDTHNPCDADRLLVVTFTKAAASEMRERIAAKISSMLLDDSQNLTLKKQQFLLPQAHICTVDSFCSWLVRENFHRLDISPDFRVADDSELLILRHDAVTSVLSDLYEQKSESFLNLVRTICSGRDDHELVENIYSIYDFIMAHPFPEQWLAEHAAMFHDVSAIEDTPWGAIVFDYAKNALNHCVKLTHVSLELIQHDDTLIAAYSNAFHSDLSSISAILELLKSPVWDQLSTALRGFVFLKLNTLRGYSDDPIKAQITKNRQNVKDIVDELSGLFFCCASEELNDIRRLGNIVSELTSTVLLFLQKLSLLKRERNLVDFADLEHLAIKFLIEPSGDSFTRTAQANELCSQFDYIIVDECQDSNITQDLIFRAISKQERNMFMVGDVKQSIYRFRQAMPEIFMTRKESYPLYDRHSDLYPARIVLEKNFRSRPGVIGAVNFVFSQLMSRRIGDIEYSNEEKLVPGADYDAASSPEMSVKIIDISNCGDEDSNDMDIVEARYIAQIILDMISNRHPITDKNGNRHVTYGDFCILIRSANKHAPVYVRELEHMGIPAWSELSSSFFQTIEISTVLSLLQLIDNPIDDIPLLAVMLSPIFAFSPDELANIRLHAKENDIDSLYFAVKAQISLGNTKCIGLLDEISHYRYLAATSSVDSLIRSIYERTGYTSLVQAMKNGRIRLLNLQKLLEYAVSYESFGVQGLTGFMRFINKLKERGADLHAASVTANGANVVRVMSIHKSKGLEFPVCIVANCARKFNMDRSDMLLHPQLGIAMKLRDETGFRKYNSLVRFALLLDISRADISEELRVLYVAMTRAREKLIMVMSLKEPEKKLAKLASEIFPGPSISPHSVSSCSSLSDFILLCALRHPCGTQIRELSTALPGITIDSPDFWDIEIIHGGSAHLTPKYDIINNSTHPTQASIDYGLISKINSRIHSVYPRKPILTLPAKLTVSDLVIAKTPDSYSCSAVPSFISGISMTPAQRGIAMHTFMQFADFSVPAENLEGHICDLVNTGFLSPAQGSELDLHKLVHFWQSKLLARIRCSTNVLREYKFTVNIPASQVSTALPLELANENIVLQGSIDCVFEENGEFVVIDYKTDRFKSSLELEERYKIQLDLYRMALCECTGKPVKECLLYSFHSDEIFCL